MAVTMNKLGLMSPEFRIGDYWWNHDGRLMFVGIHEINKPGKFELFFLDGQDAPFRKATSYEWYWAPTASQIMDIEENLLVRRHLDCWVAGSVIAGNVLIVSCPPPWEEYKTSHEAAASEWIARHSVKNSLQCSKAQ